MAEFPSPPRHEPDESLDQAVARVMSEADDWVRFTSTEAETVVTVYLDMKSPHAYIAVRPTLELARDYRVRLDIRPYTLSYVGMGVSTSTDNHERRPPSAEADRKARMFYAAARQYTALQRLPLRSPVRLLDARLAHRVFLFAKRQSLHIPFMMNVCLRGWGSGWREVEIESLEQMRDALAAVGGEVTGLADFVADDGPGQAELDACMEEAHASGFVGTPHYVFDDPTSGRQVGLFGREHLALIRSKLTDQGLALRDDVRPGFSHAWRGPGT